MRVYLSRHIWYILEKGWKGKVDHSFKRQEWQGEKLQFYPFAFGVIQGFCIINGHVNRVL